MTRRVNQITVKEWMAYNKIDEAHEKHLALERRHNEDNTITFFLEEPILKESEKAIYVALKTCTYSDDWHAPLKFWIPKSQIVAYNEEA